MDSRTPRRVVVPTNLSTKQRAVPCTSPRWSTRKLLASPEAAQTTRDENERAWCGDRRGWGRSI
jgi:hypothetical protein